MPAVLTFLFLGAFSLFSAPALACGPEQVCAYKGTIGLGQECPSWACQARADSPPSSRAPAAIATAAAPAALPTGERALDVLSALSSQLQSHARGKGNEAVLGQVKDCRDRTSTEPMFLNCMEKQNVLSSRSAPRKADWRTDGYYVDEHDRSIKPVEDAR